MPTNPPSDRGRFSAQSKRDAVLRLLRGEDLDVVSRELGVIAATLSQWRDLFLKQGLNGLRTKPADERDEQIQQLQRKLGEVTMENELLYEKIHRIEANRPLMPVRSRK